MALKAGRVGVNPNQVDPVDGSIKSSATEGYTKQEADAKFETQEAAADLQPKRLAVPIEMISGSKLTVEDALQGFNTVNSMDLDDFITAVDEVATIDSAASYVQCNGKIVVFRLRVVPKVQLTGYDTIFAYINEKFRPVFDFYVSGSTTCTIVATSGAVKPISNIAANSSFVINGFLMAKN